MTRSAGKIIGRTRAIIATAVALALAFADDEALTLMLGRVTLITGGVTTTPGMLMVWLGGRQSTHGGGGMLQVWQGGGGGWHALQPAWELLAAARAISPAPIGSKRRKCPLMGRSVSLAGFRARRAPRFRGPAPPPVPA